MSSCCALCRCAPSLLLSPLLQVRESQESIVLLDRTHTLKVQQVQKEYQEFMERIRNKAQVGTTLQQSLCLLQE